MEVSIKNDLVDYGILLNEGAFYDEEIKMARVTARGTYDASAYPTEKKKIGSINSYTTTTGKISPLTIYERATMPVGYNKALSSNQNASKNYSQNNYTKDYSSKLANLLEENVKRNTANDGVNSNSKNSGSSAHNGNGNNGGSNYNKNQYAQNYYNNNLEALQNAYNQRLAGLQSNLASTQDLLKSNYDLSKNNLYKDAERALQEAYINKMMNEKTMQQQLNSQGINGGATESAIASMLNNYGNSRNNINTTYNSNLAQLEQAYLSNLAQAQQDYNNAVSQAAADNANYRMELERMLYNAMMG